MTQVKVPPAISSDLENAVYDDWKRQAVDSAKKRAVSQFADYDTFKNMVSVAHLRPIGAEKRSNGERASAFPGQLYVQVTFIGLICLADQCRCFCDNCCFAWKRRTYNH